MDVGPFNQMELGVSFMSLSAVVTLRLVGERSIENTDGLRVPGRSKESTCLAFSLLELVLSHPITTYPKPHILKGCFAHEVSLTPSQSAAPTGSQRTFPRGFPRGLQGLLWEAFSASQTGFHVFLSSRRLTSPNIDSTVFGRISQPCDSRPNAVTHTPTLPMVRYGVLWSMRPDPFP